MRAIESRKEGRELERQVRLRQDKNSQNLIFHSGFSSFLSHGIMPNFRIFYKIDVFINCTLVNPLRVDHLGLTQRKVLQTSLSFLEELTIFNIGYN